MSAPSNKVIFAQFYVLKYARKETKSKKIQRCGTPTPRSRNSSTFCKSGIDGFVVVSRIIYMT